MKTKLLLLFTGIGLLLNAQQPVAEIKTVTDEYYGHTIEDPYRYMENLEDEKVADWFKKQGEYTRNVLDNINGRNDLLKAYKEYDSRMKHNIYNLNITKNDYYFYLKSTPNDDTGKLFFRKGYGGEEQLLFDPHNYNKDSGLKYSINQISPTEDGSMVSFTLSPNGSESSEILIMNPADKKIKEEKIDRCWFPSVSWLPGNESFLYNRLNSSDIHDPERELNSKVFYHKLGTDPKEDIEVFSNQTNPELNILPQEFPLMFYDSDAKIFFAGAFTVENSLRLFIADYVNLPSEKPKWGILTKKSDKIEDFYVNSEYIFFKSSKDAPNYKILKVDLKNPKVDKAEVVVKEKDNEVLKAFTLTKNAMYYTTSKNGVEAKVYRKGFADSESVGLSLPFTAGNANLRSKTVNHEEVWVTLNGWTKDYTRYRYDESSKAFIDETLSLKGEFPEFEDLVVKEVMVESHDGVKVPLSIIHNKNIEFDGNNPLFLMGYGAYGATINPFFYPMYLEWTNKGGVMAVAHVRGGGALGEAWYKAGYKTTKPNTWKDLIACTEYLHKNKYSSPKKTMIQGGSAGGILVGRAMTSRPDLFGVVLPQVGCMNTLRVEFSPNGPVNTPEFGTVEIEEEFLALKEMDSYHHLQDGVKYPATLITAGMNDPRVIAWQPGKFAARLQAANASEEPILFRVDYESGHGQGDSKSKRFEKMADNFSFSLWQLGHEDFQSIRQKPPSVD